MVGHAARVGLALETPAIDMCCLLQFTDHRVLSLAQSASGSVIELFLGGVFVTKKKVDSKKALDIKRSQPQCGPIRSERQECSCILEG